MHQPPTTATLQTDRAGSLRHHIFPSSWLVSRILYIFSFSLFLVNILDRDSRRAFRENDGATWPYTLVTDSDCETSVPQLLKIFVILRRKAFPQSSRQTFNQS